MNVIFVGNPNSGKTTIFNSVTKSKEHVANWHGVTVKVASKTIKSKVGDIEFFDLPGLYSTTPQSGEEKIALEFLKKYKDNSTIFNICSYETIERSIYLCYELIKQGYKVVLVINTMGGAYSRSQIAKIQNSLGIDVLQLDARKSRKDILDYLFNNPSKSRVLCKAYHMDYKGFAAVFPIVVLNREQKIDRFLLHKISGIFIFCVVLLLIFWVTFGPIGAFLSELLTSGLLKLSTWVLNWIESYNLFWLTGLFDMVFVKGLVGVFSFLPQLIILLSLLWCLEEIGYLPRIAYLFHDFLSKYQLSGRSTLSLIMGVGCTTTAVMTARNMESPSLRRRTTFLLPFISCSAKLPVFVCISSLFFVKYKVLATLVLYAFGIAVGLLALRLMPKEKQATPFIMELPRLKMPSASRVLKETLKTTKEAMIRIAGVVALVSACIWFLQNFDFRFRYVTYLSDSNMLYSISRVLSTVFVPLGFGSWQTTVALIMGFVAKESVVVTLFMLGAESLFTLNSAISFLIFILFYSPCISTLSAIRKEFGFKRAFFVAVYHTLLAYAICFVVYTFLMVFNISVIMLIALMFFVVYKVVQHIKLHRCKSCKYCS